MLQYLHFILKIFNFQIEIIDVINFQRGILFMFFSLEGNLNIKNLFK